jgi:hypothetical protein
MDESIPRRGAALALAFSLTAGGCGLTPRQKLDECRRLAQTLRTENNRLKDTALNLRAQNQDLSQRAVDDARRISEQDEAIERLEKSVTAYQAEREELAQSLETVKQQVRRSLDPRAAAVATPVKAFADAHPGWSFDAASFTLSTPSDRLFEPGKDAFRPKAADALVALGQAIRGIPSVVVAAPADAPPVTRAGYEPGKGDDRASGRFLSAARAARLRDAIAKAAGLEPSKARLAPPRPRDPDGPDDVERRFEVRLADPAPAAGARLDSAGLGSR